MNENCFSSGGYSNYRAICLVTSLVFVKSFSPAPEWTMAPILELFMWFTLWTTADQWEYCKQFLATLEPLRVQTLSSKLFSELPEFCLTTMICKLAQVAWAHTALAALGFYHLGIFPCKFFILFQTSFQNSLLFWVQPTMAKQCSPRPRIFVGGSSLENLRWGYFDQRKVLNDKLKSFKLKRFRTGLSG